MHQEYRGLSSVSKDITCHNGCHELRLSLGWFGAYLITNIIVEAEGNHRNGKMHAGYMCRNQ